MKTQRKNRQPLNLKTRNNRWKWMAGATAATAAGVTASHASTITINLLNNYISATGGNHLNADLTGDGHPDLTIANPFFYVIKPYRTAYPSPSYNKSSVRVFLNGVSARAFHDGYYPIASAQLGSRLAGGRSSIYGPATLMGSIPIFFKDPRINGGAPTKGSLEVTVDGFPGEIQLDSFTYNTPDQRLSRAVPDQGSSLALLALGAGGILAFRRWRAAQGRS